MTPKLTNNQMASVFVEHWLSIFGPPNAVLSDRGSSFTGTAFEQMLSSFGITHKLTTSYHPQTNGAVERRNGFYRSLIATIVINNFETWDVAVPLATYAINTSFNVEIQQVPYTVMFGIEPPSFVKGGKHSSGSVDTHTALVIALKEQIAAQLTGIQQMRSQNTEETNMDISPPLDKYPVGSVITLKTPPHLQTHKFSPVYSGQFTVVRHTGLKNLGIVPVDGGPEFVVHVARVRKLSKVTSTDINRKDVDPHQVTEPPTLVQPALLQPTRSSQRIKERRLSAAKQLEGSHVTSPNLLTYADHKQHVSLPYTHDAEQ